MTTSAESLGQKIERAVEQLVREHLAARGGGRGAADAPAEVLAELERLARSLDAATLAGLYRA